MSTVSVVPKSSSPSITSLTRSTILLASLSSCRGWVRGVVSISLIVVVGPPKLMLKENNKLEILEVTTPPPPPSTEMDIQLDILHKGTPKHEQTTVEADSLEEEEQETEETLTEEPQYEYEYVYYYEDELPDEDEDILDKLTTTEREPDSSSRSSLKSLLSFLNKESTTFSEESEPVRPAPTPYPAIRDSTIQYDMGDNYPELQRSTVTVEIEDDWSR